ncbi:lysoplasmalogenase [Sanyastnella coralliicola]|uniref:lysoplasmalogenase n=1 Tax=Sanyastnella coralliicola TaxID=3069118 RepID=UPI0027B98AC3|nr:lysoplasmalogenase [Longitalea sp. SCSIO 12813]
MKKQTRLLVIIYLIWLIAELYTETIQWDYPVLHGIMKGGLMPILTIISTLARKSFGKLFPFFILAQLFSWFGDILLLGSENESYFIAGLSSFLIAQLLYALTFFKAVDTNFEQIVLRKYPLTLIIPVALSGTIFSILKNDVGEMMIPVLFYTFAITTMLLGGIARWRKTSRYSFWFVALGAAIFMLSDTLIAFNRFHSPISYSDLYIMGTYGSAQLMLTLGIVAHVEEWRS